MSAKWGALMLLGFIMIIGALMWDSSIGMAWEDLNNSTTAGTTQHAATSSGRLFGTGFGALIAIFGIVLMIGSVIALMFDASHTIGRGGR
jgi:hypothetical protein